MKCPKCSKDEDRVVDSRSSKLGSITRRRRECLKCGFRFTTYEYVERVPVTVIKRDGSREPYDRNKLLEGIVTACRKRPISREQLEGVVDKIENTLADDYKVEVTSAELGEMVLTHLLRLDQVSYVRFASVYRKFEDINEFSKELKTLKRALGRVRSKLSHTKMIRAKRFRKKRRH